MFNRLSRTHTEPSNGLEALEGRSLLSADLVISVGTLGTGFDRSNFPTIKMPVTVVNHGNMPLQGGGTIEYFLSQDQTLDASDYHFSSAPLPRIAAGGVARLTLNTVRPALVSTVIGPALAVGDYFVIAKIVPKVASADSDSSNNQAVSATTVNVNYLFGEVNGRKNVPLSVTLANGATAVFNLEGVGTGQVLDVDNEIIVVINGIAFPTTVRITPGKANQDVTLHGLTINGSFKSLNAANVNIDGNVTIGGTVDEIRLGNVSNSVFRISGTQTSSIIQLGQVTNSTLESNTPLHTLAVRGWKNTDAVVDQVGANYIENLTSTSDFEASVGTGTNHNGFSIATVTIAGTASGTWNINGSINFFHAKSLSPAFAATVRGEVKSLYVDGNASGTIGATKFARVVIGGDLTGATLIAGADFGVNGTLDGTLGGDSFSTGAIGVFEVRGHMINSFVGSGIRTSDAILLNGDDQLDSNSFISVITVKKGMTNSHFATNHMPAKAIVNFKSISTAGNSSFVSRLNA